MNLRDHDQPCEHERLGRYWNASVSAEPLWLCAKEDCPGGREVTPDYQAAIIEGAENGIDELGVRAILQVGWSLTAPMLERLEKETN